MARWNKFIIPGIILILVMVLPCPTQVNGDSVVTFPDVNLESAIRDALPKPSGDIYASELTGLTSLSANSAGIISLTGIEYCTNLTYLSLYENQISDLTPLAGFTNLQSLYLSGNPTSDLTPLAGLTSLTYLYLEMNQISDLSPLAGLTSLTGLYLGSFGSGNQISNIAPLAGLTNLHYLCLSHNQISNLTPLAGLTSSPLTLNLSNNQISVLSPLAGLTNLTNLDLSYNLISDLLPLVNNAGLDSVLLRNNPLSYISVNVHIPDLQARGVYVEWDIVVPAVTTTVPANVITNSATFCGNLTSLGNCTTVNVSFQYGTRAGSYTNETAVQLKSSTGAFSNNIAALTSGTTYYYRAKAVGNGTSYGEEKRFVTSGAAPPIPAPPPAPSWTIVNTPDTGTASPKALLSPIVGGLSEGGSELIKLLVGNDGTMMYAVVAMPANTNTAADETPATISRVRLLLSQNGGISWTFTGCYDNLDNAVQQLTGGATGSTIVWDIAIAPDDPNIIMAAVSNVTGGNQNTQYVFISFDAGAHWDNAQWPTSGLPDAITIGTDFISAMDISMDHGDSKHDFLVATRSGGTNNNNIWVVTYPGFADWNVQNEFGAPVSTNPLGQVDIMDAKFSPNYDIDATIVVLYTRGILFGADMQGTFLVTGVHDIVMNSTQWQSAGQHVEIMNPSNPAGASALIPEIISGMIQLPTDFSGQSAGTRRFYISIDADPTVDTGRTGLMNMGVYRVDENIVYPLMDNSTTFNAWNSNAAGRRAHSIAYWGTCASGKLLVGTAVGSACTASIQVWFTSYPTLYPVPVWYPSRKPPTGAAGQPGSCSDSTTGFGNAYVVWSPIFAAQGVAYTVTGSSTWGPYAEPPDTSQTPAVAWPAGIFKLNPLDESAFALTRSNGETWNELSLIDTRIMKLTDVAPSADGTTIYLASVNNGTECQGFDSIWRSSINEKVMAPPLPAVPIGHIWERVRTSPTAISCNSVQNDYAILRLAPDKFDGQTVGWAAGGTSGLNAIGDSIVGANTGAMACSTNYGDLWHDVHPRILVQDFAFETSSILYVLDIYGHVQKMPYTGTAWSSSLQTVDTSLTGGHTIAAQAPDKVLVGNKSTAFGAQTEYPVAVSTNGGNSFTPATAALSTVAKIGYHALFDTTFASNSLIYVASDQNNAGAIYRNTLPSGASSNWVDMCASFTTHREYYGIVQVESRIASEQCALYAAHDANTPATWSGVERTLGPLNSSAAGLQWDCLDASASGYQSYNPLFTLEPKSLKLGGSQTLNNNATLFAIDNRIYANNQNAQTDRVPGVFPTNVRSSGMLWTLSTVSEALSVPVSTATGTGTATFTIDSGSVTSLTANTSTPCGIPAGLTFPHGFFSINIANVTPGSTQTITIVLPSNIPSGAQYWKCINDSWVDMTSLLGDNDGDNILTLTLTDGGLGDIDELANGTIVDPGGPAVPEASVQPPMPKPFAESPSAPEIPEHTIYSPARLSIKYLNIQPQQAQTDQPVTIYANIANGGDEACNYTVTLKINDRIEDTRTGKVGGHAAVPLKFIITKEIPGTYSVEIDGQRGIFTIINQDRNPNNARYIYMTGFIFCIFGIIILSSLLVLRRRAVY